MREIKFRAWLFNPADEIEWGEWAEYIELDCDGWVIDNTGSWKTEELYENGIYIEQYTGIKDKNGVEIYEGDIVSLDRSGYHDAVVVKIPNIYYCQEAGYREEEWEVRGNIHENPERLEPEEE